MLLYCIIFTILYLLYYTYLNWRSGLDGKALKILMRGPVSQDTGSCGLGAIAIQTIMVLTYEWSRGSEDSKPCGLEDSSIRGVAQELRIRWPENKRRQL